MSKTTVKEKKYVDAPRFKVIESYEKEFIDSFSQLTRLMTKDIVKTAEKFIEKNGTGK